MVQVAHAQLAQAAQPVSDAGTAGKLSPCVPCLACNGSQPFATGASFLQKSEEELGGEVGDACPAGRQACNRQ